MIKTDDTQPQPTEMDIIEAGAQAFLEDHKCIPELNKRLSILSGRISATEQAIIRLEHKSTR